MTAALEGSEWSAARPDRTLPPEKTPYPFYRRLGGPQGRSGRSENLVPTGIRSRTVQSVVSRYTDSANTDIIVYNKQEIFDALKAQQSFVKNNGYQFMIIIHYTQCQFLRNNTKRHVIWGWLLLRGTRVFSHLQQENNIQKSETGSFIY